MTPTLESLFAHNGGGTIPSQLWVNAEALVSFPGLGQLSQISALIRTVKISLGVLNYFLKRFIYLLERLSYRERESEYEARPKPEISFAWICHMNYPLLLP